MKLLIPDSWQTALAMKADSPDAIPVAGGTDLYVCWAEEVQAHDRTYLDLSHLDSLRDCAVDQRSLTLGALTTYWDLLRTTSVCSRFPLLRDAAREVGAVQIQSRGTWAGNIANASPAADGVAAMMAHDATVRLACISGVRDVPLCDYYLGYKQTVQKPSELIQSISLPVQSCYHHAFVKVGARRAQAITKTGAAITHTASGWRIVAISMAPTTRRCRALEQMLQQRSPTLGPLDFASAIAHDIQPIDDIRSTATYRTDVFCRIVYDAIRPACDWLG